MANLQFELSVTDTDVFKELAKEVVFLRAFYKYADTYSGPASGDLYDLFKESYCGEIPEEYK